MPAIVFDNLSKIYKKGTKVGLNLRDWVNFIWHRQFKVKSESFYAVKNLNLTIEKGEVVGFIGKNGAGKSTVLKLASRVAFPTSGSVVATGKVAGLLELGAGFHPELTGRENIFFQAAILGMTKKEIELKQEEMIAFSELKDFIDTPVKYYSSGMYARLGFSVAIYLNPDILLIDEILSVGDASFQDKCIRRIKEFCRNKQKTVVIVSHNFGYLQELCQRVFWLDNGEMRMQGRPEKVIPAYLESLK